MVFTNVRNILKNKIEQSSICLFDKLVCNVFPFYFTAPGVKF
jgi:hypothetical protein